MLRVVLGLFITLIVRQCDSILPSPEPTLDPQVAACYAAYPDRGITHGVTGTVISAEPITVVGCPTPSCNMHAITSGFKMWELMPGDTFVITEGPYCGHGWRNWAIESADGERYGWIDEFTINDAGKPVSQIAAQD